MKGITVRNSRAISATTAIAVMMLCMCPHAILSADPQSEADRVLHRYFDEIGGLKELADIKSISTGITLEAYNYEYTTTLRSDGCFRIHADNITTVFDGTGYWRSFHGMVSALPPDQAEEYSHYSLKDTFLQGLIGADGNPVTLVYRGTEKKQNRTYEVLTTSDPVQPVRTYYFNADTGLLDKMIELADDPELQQIKNVYYFFDYEPVGEVRLFTRAESVCITTGQNIQPLSRFSEIRVNEQHEAGYFAKPPRTAPFARFMDGMLSGQIIGLSRRGSAIVNISNADMEKLGAQDGMYLDVQIKDHMSTHRFFENLGSAEGIGRGDYLAAFNQTPALWIVKAYMGMTSDLEITEGDSVSIRLSKPGSHQEAHAQAEGE
jgi:hypothetical protein